MLQGCLLFMLLRKLPQSYFQAMTPEINHLQPLTIHVKNWSQTRKLPCSDITVIAKLGPEASFLDSQTHVLRSGPFSHSEYQATLTFPHRRNILFLRVHSDLESRGYKNLSPCSGQVILFFTFCNVESYSNSLRSTNP